MRTVPTGPSDHYIRAFIDRLTELERAEATIETYRSALRLLDAELRPHGLVRSNADEIKAVIWKRPDPRTRRAYCTATRGLFRFACDPARELRAGDPEPLDFDPTAWLPTVKRPRNQSRHIDTEVLRDVLARATEPHRTWFLLAAGCGLRCIEISNLDRQHITKDDVWIQGKGGHTRTVPTGEEVWAAVRDLPRGPIARNRRGDRATRRQVDGRGNHHLQHTLGVSLAMHDLRRWYATNVHLAANGDLRVSQELLGHASPTTTAIYVDPNRAAMRAAVAALPLPV